MGTLSNKISCHKHCIARNTNTKLEANVVFPTDMAASKVIGSFGVEDSACVFIPHRQRTVNFLQL